MPDCPPADATPPMEPESLDKDARPASAEGVLGRLKHRAGFQRAARGRRKALDAFTLQSVRRPDEDEANGARVGFTVTKKVGNAVVRNRIRRRLREALRAASPLEAREDHDYVLMARREALAREFVGLVQDLRVAFGAVAQGGKNTAKGKDRRP